MKEKIRTFLKDNGYKLQTGYDRGDYETFIQDRANYAISIEEKEIIMCDSEGNTMLLPLNIYALIGFLIQKSEIGVGYNDTVFFKTIE